ncbi:dTDP-glucose 4,6-dehydratase [candidate division KSB1 bacterium]
MRILVTGGAGFIGSNYIRLTLEESPDVSIVNLDALTYSGNLNNLSDVQENFPERYSFFKGDICDPDAVEKALDQNNIDIIINFAAETHVDRSIADAEKFISTNIIGTRILLEAAVKSAVDLFIQVSTDEVYGSLGPEGEFTEESPVMPNSPYAASKAAADHFVRAYHNTYNVPTIITRCSNNYGPYQFPEKIIPLFITNALENKALPLYGDGKNIRDWIHVADHAAALNLIVSKGRIGEVYNIGAHNELENRTIAEMILDYLDKPYDLVVSVKDRPGHDRRYSINSSKLKKETGWEPQISFEKGLTETIEWYKNNTDWIKGVITKEYREYYSMMYGSC